MELEQKKESFLHRLCAQMSLWFLEKKSTLFYGFLALVALAFFLGRYAPFLHREKELISLEDSYQKWKGQSNDMESWKALQKSLDENGFLKEKYAAEIAQKWLCKEDLFKAKPLAENSLKKVEKELGLYAFFSKTSLTIMEGNLEKALQEALELKKKMKEDPLSPKTLLFGHNLMRILFLERSLKMKSEEELVSKELEEYLQRNHEFMVVRKEALSTQEFRKQKPIGLAEFLQHRKNKESEN